MEKEIISSGWPEWRIIKKIGRGSFGTVYEAVRTDHSVESHAAIKVISIPQNESEIDSLRSEGLSKDATRTYLQGVVNDFVSEIQLMEQFKGLQNIVSVEDYKVEEKEGEIGWNIYIRMELLTPFNNYISDKKLSEKEVIKLGIDICTALELCATRNVIHRDIKPENIFVHRFGDFKLGDFGIARELENVTGGLSQKGTYNYMAPEIEKGNQYDATVDIYSLGLVLYRYTNNNRLPFLDTSRQLLNPNERMTAIRRRMAGEPLPVPCDASPALAEVILCATNPDPSKRFASAAEMKKALNRVANGIQSGTNGDLDKTVSIRPVNNAQDPNRTTAVRKVQMSKKDIKPVKTFGEKKKTKGPAVIVIALLAVIILVGGGTFVIKKQLDKKESQEHSLIESSGDIIDTNDGAYSDFDEEQIETAIKDADKFAGEGDYKGALTTIKAALATYPKSEALKAKEKEYTLKESENLAESGDYVSAIALIKNAQEVHGEDVDYTNAYNSYCASYKAEIIGEADELANAGDFAGAFHKIAEGTAIVGEDSELAEKSQGFEESYVSNVIDEYDELVAANKYTEASSLIDSALKIIPGNQKLMDKKTVIQNSFLKNFMDVTPPYEKDSNTSLYTGGNSFTMSGDQYSKGVTMWVYESNAWFLSNLKGEYSELQFDAGHVDGSGMTDVTLGIYLDDALYQSYSVSSSGLPKTITVPVTGVHQLKMVASYDEYHGTPTIGLGNMLIKANQDAAKKQSASVDPSAKNFMKVSPPYEKDSNTSLYTGGNSFVMSGDQYSSGVTMWVYESNAWFLSNLKGEYSELQFDAGHVDGSGMTDVTLEIYLDDALYQSYSVSSSDLPKTITVPVTGVHQLKMVASYGEYHGTPTIGLGNMLIK